MIGHLRGNISSAQPQLVVLDVSGVGYELHIPVSTYYEVQKLPSNGQASFFVHTHVREDTLQLFGFWTDRERQLFLKLTAVTGIGPKLAQSILSGMAPEDLIDSLAQGDLRRLNSIPGVGKKTAERMVLELRDKVLDLGPTVPVSPAPQDDLVPALVNLGYKRVQAERAVLRVQQESPDLEFAERLKACLKVLSRV